MFKINNKKKIMIPILTLILVVAMAGSALADTYTNQWSNFPLTTRSNHTAYNTYGVQNWLRTYSTYTRTQILANGGTDGDFGPTTEDMVEFFQNSAGLSVDGKVGSETWTAMGNLLTDNPLISSNGYRYYHVSYVERRNRFDVNYNDCWQSQRDSDNAWRTLGQ